jgi:integration host factor subunit beta
VVQLNKSDLVLRIVSLNPNIYKKDIVKVVDVFFGTISKAITKNDRVELRGFGSFDVKNREARIARNPKNGSIVAVPSKTTPFFRMGKGMKERLNK